MKKKLLLISIALVYASSTTAAVYKCKAANGKVIYQNQECPERDQMQEVNIRAVDPSIIENAQKKLQEDLDAQAKLNADQANQNIEKRKLEALEEYNTSDEDPDSRSPDQTIYFQSRSSRDTSIEHKPIDY